jgi:hypothetical protein
LNGGEEMVMTDMHEQRGYALVTVMLLMSLLMTFLVGYFTLTMIELSTTRSTQDSFVGFYAAEAGLNIRADVVAQTFVGYTRPSGSSPDEAAKDPPCEGSNLGGGDFACVDYAFQSRDVSTYVEEGPGSASPIVIPRGEPYQDTFGTEYHYIVNARADSPLGFPEAALEMHFKSRVIPLFQFAVFYDKDLEIIAQNSMVLNGPVHTNGDLYLDSLAMLDHTGQVTAAGDLYRGLKASDTCKGGGVRVADPGTLQPLPACSGGRLAITQTDVDPWNGMLDVEVGTLTVPAAADLDPVAGSTYWDNADLRIVLDLNGASPVIEVRNADGSAKSSGTTILDGCGSATYSSSLMNNREGKSIQMLEIDVRDLMDCFHANGLAGVGIDDATDGGLVWHLSVDGPDSGTINNYGVRVRNGAELASNILGAPLVKGLTIATDQAMYVEGDFNSVDKKPASFLADSMNVLSNNWNDANSGLALGSRAATTTTINAGILAGSDTTGGIEGAAGQDLGQFNGGFLNLVRLHEDWTGDTLNYLGSFVSLDEPIHVNGAWSHGVYYTNPTWNWSFDDDIFVDPLTFPPLSPVFAYLKQELFVRQFEL